VAQKETVVIVRRGPQDRDGDRPVLGEDPVDGCNVWPRTSSERAERGEVIIAGLGIAFPRGTEIEAQDQVKARGDTWDIEGVPGDYGKRVLVYVTKVGTGGAGA
jgi:hypothetical protein